MLVYANVHSKHIPINQTVCGGKVNSEREKIKCAHDRWLTIPVLVLLNFL